MAVDTGRQQLLPLRSHQLGTKAQGLIEVPLAWTSASRIDAKSSRDVSSAHFAPRRAKATLVQCVPRARYEARVLGVAATQASRAAPSSGSAEAKESPASMGHHSFFESASKAS